MHIDRLSNMNNMNIQVHNIEIKSHQQGEGGVRSSDLLTHMDLVDPVLKCKQAPKVFNVIKHAEDRTYRDTVDSMEI